MRIEIRLYRNGIRTRGRIGICSGFTAGDFTDIPEGVYDAPEGEQCWCYLAEADGCIPVCGNIVPEKNDDPAEVIYCDVDMPEKKKGGFQSGKLRLWTGQLEALADRRDCVQPDELLGERKIYLDTPSVSSAEKNHVFTSENQMREYLKNLREGAAGMYMFSFKADGCEVPVVVFSVSCLEEYEKENRLHDALRKLSSSGRLRILYQAQIHGNEPAAGEGALACAAFWRDSYSRKGEFHAGKDIPDIVVIPRVNMKGSRKFIRNDGVLDINLNRDAMDVQSEVTFGTEKIFTSYMPEVFIDGHEYNSTRRLYTGRDGVNGMEDVMFSCVKCLNRSDDVFGIEKEIISEVMEVLDEKGLETFWFESDPDSPTACTYSRLEGAATFLVETRGIMQGGRHFSRRTAAQFLSVTGIAEAAARRRNEIIPKVAEGRKAWEKESPFVTAHGRSGGEYLEKKRRSYDFYGNEVKTGDPESERHYLTDRAVETEIRPAGMRPSEFMRKLHSGHQKGTGLSV